MKPLKLSFLLIPLALALLLGGASKNRESAQNQIFGKRGADEHEDAPNNIKQSAKNKTPDRQPTTLEKSFVETLRTITDQQKTANEQTRAKQESWWSPLKIQIGLLVIAAIYTFFAGLQWWAIRNQAIIATDGIIEARKAAEAAQKSADTASHQTALIFDHERAWMMVRPQKPRDWPLKSENSYEFPLNFDVEWSAINVGKTPAFLKTLLVNLEIINLPLPDQRPKYPVSSQFARFIIPPNGDHRSITKPVILTKEIYRSIKGGSKCINFHGLVKYDDTLENREHITHFCSYWHYVSGTAIFEPVGPPDWVKYT